MHQDELENRYRSRGDDELLDAFKNRRDYTDEARLALETVIRERGLSQAAETILNEEAAARNREAATRAAGQKDYENRQLQRNPGWEFAETELDETADFLEWEMLGAGNRGWRFLSGSLALTAAVFWILLLTTHGSPTEWIWWTGGIALASGGLALLLTLNARTRLRITRNGPLKELEIKQGSYTFWASPPFQTFEYWTEAEYKVKFAKVKVPTLALGITNAQNETVVLLGSLTALDSAPPGWPHESAVAVPENARYYSEKIFRRVNIIRVKRILESMGTSAHNTR